MIKIKSNHNKHYRRSLLLTILFVLSFFGQIMGATRVNAAPGDDFGILSATVTPEKQALSAQYYVTIGGCFYQGLNDSISDSQKKDVDPSLWFNKDENRANIDSIATSCSDVVKNALDLWGWSGRYADFLKQAGCSADASNSYTCSSDKKTRSNGVKQAILSIAYPTTGKNNDLKDSSVPLTTDASYPYAAYYYLYLTSFNRQCSPQYMSNPSTYGEDLFSKNEFFVSSKASDPTTVYDKTYYDFDSSGKLASAPSQQYVIFKTNVGTTASNDYSDNSHQYTDADVGVGFYTWMYGNPKKAPDYLSETSISLFGHLRKNKPKADAADNNMNLVPCSIMIHEINATKTVNSVEHTSYWDYLKYYRQFGGEPELIHYQEPEDPTPSSTSCAVPGVGWIVCPVINFLADIADGAYAFLADKFLAIDAGLLNTDPDKEYSSGQLVGTGAYDAWKAIRNIANALLVIAFLIMIFSQTSSFGISNYGIKKLLPKLVLVAILINISFFICQLAVDISNILGYSLKSLLTNIVDLPSDMSSAGNIWGDLAGFVLGGAGVAAGTAGLIASAGGFIPALIALFGMLVAGVIALIMIFLILIVRQMLVVLLVVIAPVAFVAYLLPGTEKLFKKWKDLFTQMLVLFPVIGLIFGASTLASNILRAAWASTGNRIEEIIAAGLVVIPLFLVPGVLKGALKGVGNLGATINGLGSKMGGAARKGIDNSKYNQYAKKEAATRRALIRGGQYGGKNPFSRARSSMYGGINNRTGKFGAIMSAQGIATSDRDNEENVKLADSQLDKMQLSREELRALSKGGKVERLGLDGSKNLALRQSAIKSMVTNNDIDGMNSLWDSTMKMDNSLNSKYIRSTFANSLFSSNSKPTYFGAGAISAMKSGDTANQKSAASTAADSITANAYSADKIARADKDELAYIDGVISSGAVDSKATSRIANNANKALADDTLSGVISKNFDRIANIANRGAPVQVQETPIQPQNQPQQPIKVKVRRVDNNQMKMDGYDQPKTDSDGQTRMDGF